MALGISNIKVEFFDCENELKSENITKYKCGEIMYLQNNDNGQRNFDLQCSHCNLSFSHLPHFIEHVNEIYPRLVKHEEPILDVAILPPKIIHTDCSDSGSTASDNHRSNSEISFDRTETLALKNCKRKYNKATKKKKETTGTSNLLSILSEKSDHMSETKIRECCKCGIVFKSSKDMKIHILLKHSEKTHKCNICDKIFDLPFKLRAHLRTHNKVYKHICDVCGKRCLTLSHMKIHMCIHSGERPFKCNQCDKSFIKNSSVRRHTNNVHLKLKGRSMCNYCGKVYQYPKDLVEHIRIHTGECPFKCNFCEKQFPRKSYLIQHERIHTGEKPFKCHFCENSYATYAGVGQHEKCMHKELLKISGKLKPIRLV